MLYSSLTTRLLILKNKYNLLLFFLLILFIFRPSDQSLAYFSLWKVFLTITILTAIFNCKHHKIIQSIEIGLAIPIIFLSWSDLLWPHPWIFMVNTLCSIAFTLLCAISIIKDMLLKVQSLSETLKGVICAYFLVALAFSYLFWVIDYTTPQSFFYSQGVLDPLWYSAYISKMIYFSFVTLLAIGFGDIIPISDPAQTAVVLEGLV